MMKNAKSVNYARHAIFKVAKPVEQGKIVWNSPYSPEEIEFLKKATHVCYNLKYAQMALLSLKKCQVRVIKGAVYLIAERYFIVNSAVKKRYRIHEFSWK